MQYISGYDFVLGLYVVGEKTENGTIDPRSNFAWFTEAADAEHYAELLNEDVKKAEKILTQMKKGGKG